MKSILGYEFFLHQYNLFASVFPIYVENARFQRISGKRFLSFKGTVLQIEKALINDRLPASKVS